MTPSGTYPRRPNVGTPKFEADPLNSTYRWELYLTAGHPQNKVALMDGYSKGMGRENSNKIELLYKKLLNPVLPYLSRCDVIVVFEQNKFLPKHMHPKILELFPREFVLHGMLKQNSFITEFLSTYYSEYVKTGFMPPVEDRRKNVRQSVYFKELDHTLYNFKNLIELKAFCTSKEQKYSKTCMDGWFYRHADFQPELFEENVSEQLIHTIHQAQTYEEAQKAQEGLERLYGKHTTNRK